MTRLLSTCVKSLGLAGLVFATALAPTLSRADDALKLQLGNGSGAPAATGRSLIGAPSLGAPVGGIDYSLLLGLEFGPSGFSVGPRLTGEIMYGFMDLSPQVRLDLGGRIAWFYHSGDFDTSMWGLDFVPDVKIKYAFMDNLAVYGDFGLGLAYMHFSLPSVNIGGQTFGGSDSSVALTFQFGGGLAYAVTPKINLLGEIRFDIYTKSGSSTFINIPTVGIQFH